MADEVAERFVEAEVDTIRITKKICPGKAVCVCVCFIHILRFVPMEFHRCHKKLWVANTSIEYT